MDIQQWLTLLVFSVFAVDYCSSQRPTPVTFHVLFPKHRFWSSSINRTLYSTLRGSSSIKRFREYRGVYSVFRPETKLTFLEKDTPDEILNALCDQSSTSNPITIFHVNNPSAFPSRAPANRYINQLVHVLGLPMISWDSEFAGVLEPRHDSRTLQIAPSVFHQTQVMLSLLKRYNWTDFSIVSTTAPGHEEFISSLTAQVKESQKIPRYSASGVPNFKSRKELKELFETDSRVILLHSDSRDSKEIIDIAVELGLTGKEYVWVITSSAIARGARYAYSGFPFGLFAIDFESNLQAMQKTINKAVDIWMEGLKLMARQRITATADLTPDISCNDSSHLYWKDGEVVHRYLKNVIKRGTDPIQFTENGILKVTEFTVLNIQRKGPIHRDFVEVGKFTSLGLVMEDITWPGEASGPPKGKPARYFLRIATWKEEPYVVYRDFNDKGECEVGSIPCKVYPRDENTNIRTGNTTIIQCCAGLSIDLLKSLAQQLDFDYELFEMPDGQFGSENQETGEWNGVIGALQKKVADMAITSLKITPERSQVVDFSGPFLETGITIIVSLREGAISPTAFLEPYDYPAWCLILLFSVHATGASIFIYEWLSPYGLNQGGKSPLREHKFSLFRSFWLIWAMLFSAAVSTDTPRGVSSRFLANIWALFALVFLASYTANLAAFMITKEEYYDLSGIQDWRLKNPYATKPPFKFATLPNDTTEINMIKNHPDMARWMRKYNKPTVKLGIAALKKQDIQAFIYDATVLQYYVGKDEGCKLRAVGKWYAMSGYGVGFPKGSPWVDKVNHALLALQDAGEIERLKKFWLAGACHKKQKKGMSSQTLGIPNFTSAFILLAGGMVLGSILLILEHMYFRFGRKTIRKWDKCGCCSLVSLSMGRSLNFEQSVMEAIDLHKKHKCKDPICETQLWKVRHELDLALIKINKLQKQLA
ncbi:hypothetical protein LOTGIDRAFT_137890 [Lottia gigantea]|uniref:Glutamate receptor ionotropic, NMDA 2B n=1 Tax=Lottia gigantea TaxID=225164 RepID=V4BAW8_LOTGI|nr:hypothetical protein LOTGIDRAFT_137890 [Lottia gigantea]ESP03117.1 hypothetical protein LOTGIDRAFT_137890 [Lottia gigantea]